MNTVYGLELHLPEDKLPGYYAQIVKGIADAVTLVDRHKTLLFVDGPDARDAVLRLADKYNVETECGLWLQLEAAWQTNDRVFGDYGVTTREGNRFLDLGLASVVALAAAAGEPSELAAALTQADEHAIASAEREDGRRLLAVDRHQEALLAGIARAYRCSFATVVPAAG
ncbi:hypothetical protein [Paenibacillus sp. GCM10023250]|uniref:hypothetical protein n=1 Tax=Paenibacillus sp. GCM10023250 TaxID=3252648 RepID=UPI0036126DC0